MNAKDTHYNFKAGQELNLLYLLTLHRLCPGKFGGFWGENR